MLPYVAEPVSSSISFVANIVGTYSPTQWESFTLCFCRNHIHTEVNLKFFLPVAMAHQHLLRQRGSRIPEQVQRLFMVRWQKVSEFLCYNCYLNVGCDVFVYILFRYFIYFIHVCIKKGNWVCKCL